MRQYRGQSQQRSLSPSGCHQRAGAPSSRAGEVASTGMSGLPGCFAGGSGEPRDTPTLAGRLLHSDFDNQASLLERGRIEILPEPLSETRLPVRLRDGHQDRVVIGALVVLRLTSGPFADEPELFVAPERPVVVR